MIENMSANPILFREDLKCICYEWHQYAKSELTLIAKRLVNRHGEFKYSERNTQIKFSDGFGIVIGKIHSLNSESIKNIKW